MSKHNLKYVSPHEITPYYNNPRNNDAAVPKVAESIQAYGFQQPILVDENMEILAGHTRWKAALVLNLEKVPVVVSHGLDEKQKRAYRIADNRFGELVDWDFQKLFVELKDLDGMPVGFTAEELEAKIGGENDPFDDKGISDMSQCGVIIICDDAAHQEKVYTELSDAGYSCKVVVT